MSYLLSVWSGKFHMLYVVAKKNLSICCCYCWASPVAQENPPANAGDWGLILGWGDALEKEMATHSSILA